jgi:3-hydroxyisobutyrate dehydrogenase
MEHIAFIGTGVMGRSMAAHLLNGGYPLTVYNRSADKAAELLEKGAHWAESPGAAAETADVVISMVGYPRDVEEIYLGPGGIVERANAGAILADMTTSSPVLSRNIAEKARARGIQSLDAPVSGGDMGARNATLSIMVGGDEEPFTRMLPIFRLMGKNIVRQGESGAGQHCKMSNQIVIASTMMAVSEALLYGLKAGLDPRVMLKSIESGAAGSWSLSNLVPRMLDGDFKPGFFVKHFIKDMNIALESAEELGISLPGLEKARQLYQTLAAMSREQIADAARIASALIRPEKSGVSPKGEAGPESGLPDKAAGIAGIEAGGDLGTQALFLLYAGGL